MNCLFLSLLSADNSLRKSPILTMYKMCFYGYTYIAKQQKANGIWCLFYAIYQVLEQFFRIEELKINVKSINIPTVNMKCSNFQFSLGEILSSLCKIFKSCFHGNHRQKREMLCAVKVFHGG